MDRLSLLALFCAGSVWAAPVWAETPAVPARTPAGQAQCLTASDGATQDCVAQTAARAAMRDCMAGAANTAHAYRARYLLCSGQVQTAQASQNP